MTNSIWNDRIAGPKSPTTMQLGYFVMRLMLGLTLFMHGSMRLLSGVEGWMDRTAETFVGTILPMPLVTTFLTLVPTIQLTLGTLLLLGLFMRPAILGSILLFLAFDFGHGARQLWPDMHMVMHYSIYFWILLIFYKQNWLALDNKIAKKN